MTVNKCFDRVVFFDASDVGFGGFANSDVDSHLENIDTFGNRTDAESLGSFTWGELEYAERVINTCSHGLDNKQVKINSDNKNVEHILKVGRKKTTYTTTT